MFLLVSVRHVGAHPGEHQHGISKQISLNLGKTFLRISRNLVRVFAYLPPLSFPRFWTLSVQRFWFLFWSILKGVTLKLKTSNIRVAVDTRHPQQHNNYLLYFSPALPIPSLTFYGPPSPSLSMFCDARISSLFYFFSLISWDKAILSDVTQFGIPVQIPVLHDQETLETSSWGHTWTTDPLR